jgi:hypothetical protein
VSRIALLLVAIPLLLPGQPKDPEVNQIPTDSESFEWKPALLQSGFFLGIQHSSRMFQDRTRRNLGGPFWNDYFESVGNIRTWGDGDSFLTNYIGHPMIGAVSGYLQIQNDPKGRRQEFDLSSTGYWKSRLKALAWSAAYSTQFEIGPVSEASIGNVGKLPPTMAWVDLVVTPAGGFGLMLLEDYLDRRFVARWENGGSKFRGRFLRVVLNPNRSLANLLRLKRPSYRDARPF